MKKKLVYGFLFIVVLFTLIGMIDVSNGKTKEKIVTQTEIVLDTINTVMLPEVVIIGKKGN
ncbi:hypothetical protein M0Q97_03345 [Candidatus Dojkabacteria bacterium]|jgi:hypothetical protein|nr:hypothetical protein [Candidatus Dojkabacteria bacterium]